MRCPNRKCRRETPKIIIRFTRAGKKIEGCQVCNGERAIGVRKGRKIWSAYEAYGVKKTVQMNHDWIENKAQQAAQMRRRTHHSRFIQ